jgi:hypothetical protein
LDFGLHLLIACGFERMKKALLPGGTEIYCSEPQHIVVSVPDKGLARRIDRAIRRALHADTRYVRIHIFAEGEHRAMQAEIRWGDAKQYVEYPALFFAPGEQIPQRIAECILEVLDQSGQPAMERKHPSRAETRPAPLVAAGGVASTT